MNNAEQVYLRDYSKLYTGSNQEGGYDNPFLGFITESSPITFKTDKSTYFHYPNTANQLPLSATDMIESGAFAAEIPYRADKIFKKQANYENNTVWGSTLPENTQKGVWLCAWLSGNTDPTITPVWIDRWFKPGQFDSTFSLFTCSTSAVYDEPSQMTFDPGVWYRYDHMGDTANAQIVNLLSCLEIHIDDWDQISTDASGNGNNAILQNYTISMISSSVNPAEKPEDTSLKLNGIDQYGTILYNPSFNVENDLTCNVWVKSNNWENQLSHHFISNGLRGGWSIGINNGFFTPFSILVGNNGSIIFNNQTDNFYKDIVLPGLPAPVSFAVDPELYTWVLDNGIFEGQKHLYRIDYNGNIDNAVYFSSGIELRDITIDQNNSVWVLADQPYVSAFNPVCDLVNTSNISGTKIVVNGLNTLSAFNATDACVFENDYYWTINSGDLYYSTPLSASVLSMSGLSATNVQCSKDYVWALYDTDKIIRFQKYITQLTNEVTFVPGISTTLPDTSSSGITGRNLFITNEFRNGTNRDYIWILQPDTEYLYKYDVDLVLQQKTSIIYIKNSIQCPPVKGDSSGYQWHRQFNYSKLEVDTKPQIEASVYLETGSPIISGQKYTTIIPISSLTINDWHMFSFNIDNTKGKLELYMDTTLRDTVSIPASSSIFYKYETPLIIGSNIGHITTLDNELNKINRIYHFGSFDDLRLYTCPLNISDIRHIYLTKFNFKDLVWDMPTGSQSYIEEIIRFFKFKMPGQKSQYYNIHLKGLQIQDTDVRKIIEDIIKDSIQKIVPLYTSLYKIVWD